MRTATRQKCCTTSLDQRTTRRSTTHLVSASPGTGAFNKIWRRSAQQPTQSETLWVGCRLAKFCLELLMRRGCAREDARSLLPAVCSSHLSRREQRVSFGCVHAKWWLKLIRIPLLGVCVCAFCRGSARSWVW